MPDIDSRLQVRAFMSWLEWLSLPRPSAVHEAYRVDPMKNKIPGNKDSEAHVAYVFNHVLGAVGAGPSHTTRARPQLSPPS